MATFDAGSAVEDLNWDFTAYGGGSGKVPEPSEKLIVDYYKELKEAISSLRGIQDHKGGSRDNLTQTEIEELMKQMETVDIRKINTEVKKAVAKLCQNSPSVAELNKLPYRVLNAFVTWIQGEMSPEDKSAGTTPSLEVVRGA